MEAQAKFDFTASEPDELTFKQGNILKVISMEDDANWYKAELNGKIGYVPKTYIDMKPNPWFLGKISRAETEKLLLLRRPNGDFIHPDGAFVVRYSESSPGDISISVKCLDNVQHYKVLSDSGKYYLWVVKFNSINELIDYHRTSSVSRTSNLLLKDMAHTDYAEPNHAPNRYVKAAFDFEPQEEGEIQIRRGDVIRVIDKYDDNWLTGEVDGRTGLFPASYVRPYP